MTFKAISVIGWICFGLDVALVIALFVVKNAGDDAAGRGVSRGYALVLFPILLAAGGLLLWGTRSQSKVGIIAGTLLVGLPFLMLARGKISNMMGNARHNRFEASAGEFPDKTLNQAVKLIDAGDTTALRTFLTAQTAAGQLPLTVRSPRGFTLLGYAAYRASGYDSIPAAVPSLRTLLESGVPYASDAMEPGGDWVRDIVVQYGDRWNDVITLGLEHGANVNALEKYDNHKMILSHELTTAKLTLLLKHGADLNAISIDGESTLMRAVRFKKWGNALFFLEHGVDVNYRAPDGSTLQSVLAKVEASAKEYAEAPGEGYEAFVAALKAKGAGASTNVSPRAY